MSGRRYPERPLVGVGVVVVRGETVLLVRRARPPLADRLSFPGGAQRLGETVEEAARRELAEETGVEAGALRLVAHADVIERDEEGLVRFHYTVLDMAADWQSGEPRAGDDVSEAFFTPIADLESLGLDATHRDVVRRATGPS